jgi:ketosteroid isomerase-like protein
MVAMDAQLERRLHRMLDEHEIERLIMGYGRAVDRADRAELAAIFHPDAVEHHGTFEGSARGYVEYAINTALPRYDRTSHYLTNCVIHVDGDAAAAETYLLAAHLRHDDAGHRHLDLMNSRLIDKLERRDGEWRIVERTVVQDWDKTETIEQVEKWQGAFVRGERGTGDLSYAVRAGAIAR